MLNGLSSIRNGVCSQCATLVLVLSSVLLQSTYNNVGIPGRIYSGGKLYSSIYPAVHYSGGIDS